MSSASDMMKGFRAQPDRATFKRPMPSYGAPEEPQSVDDGRVIRKDTSKELQFKTQFSIASGGSSGVFSTEVFAVGLEKPAEHVDVFLSISAPTSLASVTGGGELEIAATLYAAAGGAKAVVGRAAYLIDTASPTAIDPYIYLGSCHTNAERFDLSLRVGGPFTDNGGVITGNIAIIGTQHGAPNYRKPRLALQAPSAVATTAPYTIARACSLHGLIASNANATGTFLMVFDTATQGTVADGTVPIAQWYIPATTTAQLSFGDEPIEFLHGLVWQASNQAHSEAITSAQSLSVQLKYA